MGETIPVMIERYCEEPPRYKILCCDGGVVSKSGCVELHQNNALVFEGEDGYESAVRYIESSPRFILEE